MTCAQSTSTQGLAAPPRVGVEVGAPRGSNMVVAGPAGVGQGPVLLVFGFGEEWDCSVLTDIDIIIQFPS